MIDYLPGKISIYYYCKGVLKRDIAADFDNQACGVTRPPEIIANMAICIINVQ